MRRFRNADASSWLMQSVNAYRPLIIYHVSNRCPIPARSSDQTCPVAFNSHVSMNNVYRNTGKPKEKHQLRNFRSSFVLPTNIEYFLLNFRNSVDQRSFSRTKAYQAEIQDRDNFHVDDH